MSVQYVPVQWNRNKYGYDLAMLVAVGAYLVLFLSLAPLLAGDVQPIDGAIYQARAFGSAVFLMLTVILAIGPLARLDRRFLPLLYNRRHFGVFAFLLALTHASFVVDWYFNFSPIPKFEAVLAANTSYGQVLGFPFETLGLFALVCLAILAATSHDFWLSFLTPRIWKALHYLIYPAYALIVAHIGLGALQREGDPAFAWVVGAAVLLVSLLHAAAALKERREPRSRAALHGWEEVCDASEIEEGRARVALLSTGERAAVFRHEGRLSAISNACAHQNGPLGEGRIVGGCVTCPWHGFQYAVTDGRSPAPFTEMVPTYRLRLDGTKVLIDPVANPPGFYVEPLDLHEQGVAA
jgi:nitrite reductase/ring-hydroxylating ferredoxin subunit/DMSO/TMAO reductase YedYZ heme-binding membrane subunit